MKPFIDNRDLLKLLPAIVIGYPLLYTLGVAYGTGPVPPVHLMLDNLALFLWIWFAMFVVNTALYRVQVRRERQEQCDSCACGAHR